MKNCNKIINENYSSFLSVFTIVLEFNANQQRSIGIADPFLCCNRFNFSTDSIKVSAPSSNILSKDIDWHKHDTCGHCSNWSRV